MRIYATIYILAYSLLIITLIVLPFYSFEGYTIIKNTIGELGAQKAPGNWVANATFILLSIAIVLLAYKQLRPYWKQLSVLFSFSISLFFMGIHQLAGKDINRFNYNYTDDALHFLFSVLTFISFCLFCVLFVFIIKQKKYIWQTLVVFLLTIITPFLMNQFAEFQGLFQRILILVSLGWLFFALTKYPLSKDYSGVSRSNQYKKHNTS